MPSGQCAAGVRAGARELMGQRGRASVLQSTLQELRLGGPPCGGISTLVPPVRALHALQAQAAYQKMQEDGVQPNARFYTGAQCMPPCLTRPALLAVLCRALHGPSAARMLPVDALATIPHASFIACCANKWRNTCTRTVDSA